MPSDSCHSLFNEYRHLQRFPNSRYSSESPDWPAPQESPGSPEVPVSPFSPEFAQFIVFYSSFHHLALITSKDGCKVTLVASLAFLLCVFSNVCSNCFPRGMHIHTCCICFTFSPLCVLEWTLRLLSCNVAKSHWLHLLGFSPLCLLKCFLKLSAREDA